MWDSDRGDTDYEVLDEEQVGLFPVLSQTDGKLGTHAKELVAFLQLFLWVVHVHLKHSNTDHGSWLKLYTHIALILAKIT